MNITDIDKKQTKFKSQETKRIIQEVRKEVIDNETGEIRITETNTVSRVPSEPNYIKIYLDDIMHFMDMPSSSSGILFSIAKRMGYDNKVTLVKPIKEDIAKETGMDLGTINNAITNFKKKDILVSAGRSVYTINPHLIGKGSWQDIYKLRLNIEYNPDGTRSIKTYREDKEEVI